MQRVVQVVSLSFLINFIHIGIFSTVMICYYDSAVSSVDTSLRTGLPGLLENI